MNPNNADNPVHYLKTRSGGLLLEYRRDIQPESILNATKAPGAILKTSKKSQTRRVGNWVLKETVPTPVASLKYALLRQRYRRGWNAALFLQDRGVLIPAPLAFVEKKRLGLVTGNAMVSEFLDGFSNVEQWAVELLRHKAGPESIHAFFAKLADALNRLSATGAYHADLSGKNIFTKDGERFYFIDLDAVTLNTPYADALRWKNHVQLYDSFRDGFGDEFLVPFLALMLPEPYHIGEWAASVKEGQRRRRAAQERGYK